MDFITKLEFALILILLQESLYSCKTMTNGRICVLAKKFKNFDSKS